MTLYDQTLDCFPSISISDRGISDTARELDRIKYCGLFSITFSNLKRKEAINKLLIASIESTQDNWDAYQARGTDPNSFAYSIQFLDILPSEYPIPEIAIDNDGEVAFEWDFGPRNIISIRISRDGSLNYAGLVGFSSFHGNEIMRDEIPEPILNGIKRVLKIV